MRDIEAIRLAAETPSRATAADLESVVADLTDAFAVDPHMNWFFRDDAKKAAARADFFRLLVGELAMADGRIDRPAGGGAAAVWMPFEALGPNSLIQELRAIPTLLRATGWSRFGRLLAIREDMDKHHPMDRPHMYLWLLGVATDAQGHGIGSRLLKAATDRLDRDAMPAYLETGTTRNVALYQRHGFEVISEHKARADAPNMWSMWRDPQPA
ncbi:MAG: GNAT family N-acetyltransferase [Caulobacteraceae bacterium]